VQVVRDVVAVGQGQLLVERPPDADALLDEDAFEREEFLPYWAELWPSGIALARHVAARTLAGRSVLELGCGLALPSIAAALGGAHVIASDWSEDALAFASRNAALNGAALTTVLLRWDDPAPLASRAPFDLVLAADVLYERRNGAELLDVLQRTVAATGLALVADPGRPHAAAFLDELRDAWTVETVHDPLLPRGGIHRATRPR
jgi:predicted nicotinamide N-methyase